jgi:RNA recognition motif-containing protein
MSELELHNSLRAFGTVVKIIPLRRFPGASDRRALAWFSTQEEAQNAITELNGMVIGHVKFHVAPKKRSLQSGSELQE